MDALLEMLPLLIPILTLDAALAVAAALYVLRHPHYRLGSKTFWLVVVVAFLLIGPIIYFAVGRGEELLSLVGLGNVKKTIGGFSRGMKQRLGIAQALLTRPKLLICDEPTSALDPVGRKEILDILRKISSITTVLFSTHILSDVERICGHAALLHQGKIVVGGTLSEIKALHGHESLLLEFSTDDALHTSKNQDAIQPLLATSETTGKESVLHSQEMEKVQHTVFRVLAEAELCPIKIEIMEPSLESLFWR